MEEIPAPVDMVVYPIIYKGLNIPGGARFLPSPILWKLASQMLSFADIS